MLVRTLLVGVLSSLLFIGLVIGAVAWYMVDTLIRPKKTNAFARETISPFELGLPIRRIALNAQRSEAIVVARNGILSRWALESPPRMVAAIQTPHSWIADIAPLVPGEEFLVTAPGGVEIRRWTDLTLSRSLVISDRQWLKPTAVATSPDGRWIAVRDFPEEMLLIDRSTGAITGRTKAGEWTSSVQFSPNSQLLATACSFQAGAHVRLDRIGPDGQLMGLWKAWCSDHRTQSRKFVDTLARVAFDPSGKRLALFETSAVACEYKRAGWRGNVVLLDVEKGDEMWNRSVDAAVTSDDRNLSDAGFSMGFLTDVVFGAGGSVVACGATRGSVLFYDVASGLLLGKSIVHESAAVCALAYDDSADRFWGGLDNGQFMAVPLPNEA